MIFTKIHSTEHANATLTESDEKTFRKWVLTVLGTVSNLKLVRFIYCLL